jgi:hypothetical protein
VCPARRSEEDVKAKNSAVEAAGGGTERVCANPSMCKRAETRRNIDPPTVQPPGTSLVKSAGMFASGRPARIFLILQKLIVMAAYLIAEYFDSRAFPAGSWAVP